MTLLPNGPTGFLHWTTQAFVALPVVTVQVTPAGIWATRGCLEYKSFARREVAPVTSQSTGGLTKLVCATLLLPLFPGTFAVTYMVSKHCVPSALAWHAIGLAPSALSWQYVIVTVPPTVTWGRVSPATCCAAGSSLARSSMLPDFWDDNF
jgi:hypothetical protein